MRAGPFGGGQSERGKLIPQICYLSAPRLRCGHTLEGKTPMNKSLIDSPSHNDIELTTTQDIQYCFRLILGRPPEHEEIAGHFGRVGENLKDVVKSYIQSAEFSARKLQSSTIPEDIELSRMNGFLIFTSGKDLAVGKHVRAQVYEPEIESLFRAHLTPGMTVVDIGANIGFFSMLAASLVGPDGLVVAVEPNLQNVRMLEGSRRTNGFSQIVVAAVAASINAGVLSLNPSFSNGVTQAIEGDLDALLQTNIVPCLPIKNLIPHDRRVDFIKIDVEGAEYLALKGMQAIIRRDQPIIVSEFSPPGLSGISGVSGETYLEFLISMGYDLHLVRQNGSPIPQSATDMMRSYSNIATDHIDLVAIPRKSIWLKCMSRMRRFFK